MRSVAAVIALCSLLAALPVAAEQDYDALFERALNAVDFDFHEEWAYSETSVVDGRVWIGRYDPRRPPGDRWSLTSVDGRAPNAEEIEEFRDEREEGDGDMDDGVVVEMVEPDTVRLIEETGDYWLLGFKPDEDEENFMENVQATLRISKPEEYLEFIDIHNVGVIAPAFGVRISKLITRFTFGPAVEGGRVVPLSSQVEVTGRAYLLISFDEQKLSSNSDFVYVGAEAVGQPEP